MNLWTLRCRDDVVHVAGDLPRVGHLLPSFMLVDPQLNDCSLESLHDRDKAIMTVLSVELADGARLVDEAREALAGRGVMLVVVSADSPFALRRVAAERNWSGVLLLSTLRGRDFHKDYGVLIAEHPFAGFTAPALVLADFTDTVLASERLPDTAASFDWPRMVAVLARRDRLPGRIDALR